MNRLEEILKVIETDMNFNVIKSDIDDLDFSNVLKTNSFDKSILNNDYPYMILDINNTKYFTIINKSEKKYSFILIDSSIPNTQFYDFLLSLVNGFIGVFNKKTNKLEKIYTNHETIDCNILIDELVLEEKNYLKINKDDFVLFKGLINKIMNNSLDKLVIFKSTFFNEEISFSCCKTHELDNGKIYCFFSNINDISQDRDKLVLEASIDPLTGVYNKIGITNHIKNIIESKPNKKYLIGIVDIDYFKSINDAYGHLFGDSVLKAIGSKLQTLIEDDGYVGRIGGDEFVFIKEIEKDEEIDIKPIGRQIRYDLANIEFDDVINFHVTSSIGMVAYPKDGTTYDELFKKADKALYRGKIKGKDCYIIYNEDLHGKIVVNETSYIDNKSEKPNQKLSNSSFVLKCLDLLLNTYNLDESIKKVIEEIGLFFGLDRVIVADQDNNILYNYCVNESLKIDKFYDIVKKDGYKNKFENDHMFFANSIDKNPITCDKDLMYYYDTDVMAFVQVLLYHESEFSGCISYEMCDARRVWQRDELMQYNILGKIISSFVKKLEIETELLHAIYEDSLTKMYNLTKFKDDLKKLSFTSLNYALIYFDISKFRLINDKYGFIEGDKVLIEVANGLKESLQKDEIACRMSDDKFLVLIKAKNNDEIIEKYNIISKNIISLTNKKFINIHIDLEAGAYLMEDQDVSYAIDMANIARKYAKDNNIKKVIIYDELLKKSQLEEKMIEDRMHSALENREFMIYLQPCFEIKSKKVISMEALVRWNRDGKIVSPGEFVPLFERNKFIIQLDFYVYEEVCRTLRNWIDEGYEIFPVSVNVSRCHLYNTTFLEDLNRILKKYNIDKKYIGLELTESLFVENEDKMIDFVEKLKKDGFRIYMDDFGVAYSTLNLLSKIDVDVIKLDKTFIDNNFYDRKERIIIAYIIKMAKELGINVLSEGIETFEQDKTLNLLECDYAQGYYYARPMDVEKITELVYKSK